MERTATDGDELVYWINHTLPGDTILLIGTADYDLTNASVPVNLNKRLTIKSSDGTPRVVRGLLKDYDNLNGQPVFNVTSGVTFENVDFNGTVQTQTNTPAYNSNASVKTGVDYIGGIIRNDASSQTNMTFTNAGFMGNRLTVNNNLTANTVGQAVGDIRGGVIYQKGTATERDMLLFQGPTVFQNNVIENTIRISALQTASGLWYGETKGGAIDSTYGNLIFDGETLFDGNRIVVADQITTNSAGYKIGNAGGSAIHAENSTLDFRQKATFSNNHTEYVKSGGGGAFSTDSDAFSGAVSIRDSSLIFRQGAEFLGNTSNFMIVGQGTALTAYHSDIKFFGDAVFRDNIAIRSGDGAAIYADASSSILFHGASVFENNVCLNASPYGGAVYNEGTMIFQGAANFLNNFSPQNPTDSFTAGRIYNSGTIAFLDSSVFSGNFIKYTSLQAYGLSMIPFSGGAIFNEGGTLHFGSGATFSGNGMEFTLNPGPTPDPSFSFGPELRGGGLNNTYGTVSFDGPTIFSDNSLTFNRTSGTMANGPYLRGAGVYNNGGTVNFNASTQFLNNMLNNTFTTFGVEGAAIYITDGTVNFNLKQPGESAQFRSNTANGYASGIYMDIGSVLNLNHVMGTDIYFYDPISSPNPTYYSQNWGTINQNKCGTTHVIDNFSDFHGVTNINKGYFQLENATFGRRASNFGNNVFTVGTGGTLNGDGTIGAREIVIDGFLLPGFYMDQGYHSYENGKTLNLDADISTTIGSSAVYTPMLWADGTANLVENVGFGSITVDSGATIYLNFRPGDYTGLAQSYSTLEGFTNVKKAGFINADYNSATGDIHLNGLVSNYFASHASVGHALDNMLASGLTSDGVWDYLVDLSFMQDAGMDSQVKKAYTQLTGVHRANMMTLALMNPIELSFQHIEQGLRYNHVAARINNGTLYRMQNDRNFGLKGYGVSSQNLWFQPYYRSLDVEDDANCPGYEVQNTGFLVGTDRAVSQCVNIGYFAGYSQPQLRTEYGFRGNVHDYSLGVVAKGRRHGTWEWTGWLTGGYQHYNSWRRIDPLGTSGQSGIGSPGCPPLSITQNDADNHFRGETDGWNMVAGFEIAKILAPRPGQFQWLRYRPFIGFDYSHAYQDGYTEDNTANDFCLSYMDENYDRTQFRMGASALMAFRRIDLESRIMYTCLLGGDAAPSSGAAFASMPGTNFTADGVNLGYHALSLGTIGSVYLDAHRSKIVNLTYEGTLGRRSVSHVAALGYTMMY